MKDWHLLWNAANLAGLAAEKDEQERLLREALRFGEEQEGTDSLELGGLLLDLGECLERKNDPDAEKFYLRANKLIVANAIRLGMTPRWFWAEAKRLAENDD